MGVYAGIITFTLSTLTTAPLAADTLLTALLLDFEQDETVVDRADRAASYALACEAGSAVACEAHTWRSEGPIDAARAHEALSTACAAGESAACLAVGWIDSQVRFGAAAPEAGLAMMVQACESGLSRACTDAALLQTDPAVREAQLAMGCELGEPAACRALGVDEQDVWLLERGCLLGDAPSCREAGRLLLSEEPASAALAWSFIEAGCQDGDAESCLMAAASGSADWPVALLTAGCAAYSIDSCGRLAALYAAGDGVVQSDELARQFAQVASAQPGEALGFHRLRCERGDAAGCQTWGEALLATDADRAAAVLAEGCTLGEPGACTTLGWLHAERGDFATAQSLWEGACVDGDAGGCAGVGALMRSGDGGRKADLEQAAEFDLRACALDATRCETAAWLTLRGLGTPRDAEAGTRFIREACEAGEPQACTNLGWRLAAGQGMDRDVAAAVALWESGCAAGEPGACTALVYQQVLPPETLRAPCEAGEPTACAGLGFAYMTGRGVTPDTAYGRSLLESACAVEPVCARGECAGDGAVACRWLGHVYAQGVGVKASRREAKQYYRRACELGDLLACGG